MKAFAAKCFVIADPEKRTRKVKKSGKYETEQYWAIKSKSYGSTVSNSATSCSYYVAFKQPSGCTVNYQVQRILSYRSKETGLWSKGSFHTPYTIGAKGSLPAISKNSTYNPDKWQRPNLGKQSTTWAFLPNNKSAKTFAEKYKFSSTFNPSKYDGLRVSFRIRTFKPSKTPTKSVHGPWNSTQGCTLTFLRKADTAIVAAYRQVDGGIVFDYDYTPTGKKDTYSKVGVSSVKNSEGKEILKSEYQAGMVVDSERTPTSGYTRCATMTVPAEKLSEAIEYGTRYTIEYFIVDDGVKQKTTSAITTSAQDTSIATPNIDVSIDDKLNVNVTVYPMEDADFVDVACRAEYTVGGIKQNVAPDHSEEDMDSDTAIARYTFSSVPPSKSTDIKVSFTPNGKDAVTATSNTTNASIGTQVFLKSVNAKSSHIASLYGDVSVAISSKGKSTVEQVYGRELPFAVFSKSTETSIALKGEANNIPYGVNYMIPLKGVSKISNWDDIRRNQHELYWLLLPTGEVYKVAINSLQIESTVQDYATVSVSMTEVS